MDNIILWQDRGKDETENLRAAVEWGLENHVEKSIRLAANFCIAMGLIGSSAADGLALCRSAIDKARSLPPASGDYIFNDKDC